MLSDVAFPLLAAFGLSLAIVLLIYFIGGKISAKGVAKGTGKNEPYACGEDLPAEESRVDLEKFLVFALYFLIFDILAFVLATSFYTIGIMPITYSLIVLIAVTVLMYSGRHR
ncbi:MAG: NADH-quinone oxidoreductase subunit A [Candidatus Methanomethylicaceae archaeon]|jgi:NADH:ubiquinone oxidoreductase subunit 3 (subunit A)